MGLRKNGQVERPLVLTLPEIDADDESTVASVGGKAVNLGRLTRAGLPVPPGFCLTTHAYTLAVADVLASLLDELDTASAAVSGTVPGVAPGGVLAELAARARAAVGDVPVPEAVTEAVTRAYRAMDDGEPVAVAVRSSANAEDLPFASFAGQQDTFLNVVGPEQVLDAVRRCWASLWTDRAVSYRAAGGIDHRGVRLAVVVQRMIASETAGVMFTADPVTGRRTETVIDASPGLGEAVVSGSVNPDHFVVDAVTSAVIESRLGDKRHMVRPVAGGGTVEVPLDDGSDRACLSDQQVKALVELGRRVTAHYGAPQDTEWAIDERGDLWLTQARPITTLYPLVGGDTEVTLLEGGGSGDLRVFFCFSVAQGLNRPLTPMGLSTLRVLGSAAATLWGFPVPDPVAGPAVVRDAGLRLFIDATTPMRSAAGRAVVPRLLDVMEARSAVVLRGLFDDPRLSVRSTSWRPLVRRVAQVLVANRVPLTAVRAIARPQGVRPRLAEAVAQLRRRIEVPDTATASERLDRVVGMLEQNFRPVMAGVLPVAAAGFGMLALAAKLLGPDVTREELEGVLRSVPNNVTTEMDLDLWRLSASVRADEASDAALHGASAAQLAAAYRGGALPATLQHGLAALLDRYGHRAVAEIDAGMPRWAEDPTHLLGVLQNYRRLDDPQRAPDAVFARGAEQADALVETLTARARRRGRLRARCVGGALRRARQFVGVRELPKYCFVLVLARARTQLQHVGDELAAAGRLADPGDVFFLDLREVREALDGRDVTDVVRARRDTHERELRRRHVPRVLLSDGTEPEARATARAAADGPGEAALLGTPASAGTVTGPARVVHDPVGAHLEPGEILVAPSTDPGWTPLFLTAGGLVMEMGGANSHGAVVAREYGIPAVVGVPDATARLTTGQLIRVDGSGGRVTVVGG